MFGGVFWVVSNFFLTSREGPLTVYSDWCHINLLLHTGFLCFQNEDYFDVPKIKTFHDVTTIMALLVTNSDWSLQPYSIYVCKFKYVQYGNFCTLLKSIRWTVNSGLTKRTESLWVIFYSPVWLYFFQELYLFQLSYLSENKFVIIFCSQILSCHVALSLRRAPTSAVAELINHNVAETEGKCPKSG